MTKNHPWIAEELKGIRDAGRYVPIRALQSPQGAWVTIGRRKLLNLCSNNYLGYANHPEVKRAAIDAIEAYGVGAGAVRSIAGTSELHVMLEEEIASFKHMEAALVFQGGLLANAGTIPVLVGKDDVVFSEELNHASIIDGVRLSSAKRIVYRHVDVEDLGRQLNQHRSDGKRSLIITDGVFSMDGDIAPLDRIAQQGMDSDSMIYVDDAHGEGVLGDHGRGIVDHFSLTDRVDVDREIFNYSSFSKKEQRMFERLEEIEGKIENILYLRKKIADLTDELQAYRQKIPKPEGFLDIETVAGARREEKKRELLRAMDEAKSSLRSAIVEETEAMEKLKSFLHSSGSLLDPVVRVMPRIREMTSSVVKSGSRELTEWDVDVAISRLDKFTAELADDDPLSLIGNDLIKSALDYIHNNSEALTDYNKVLKARERKQALEDEITRLRELTITFEATESIRKEKESVRLEAGKNLEIFVQIRQELERSVEELRAEVTQLASGDGGTGSATLEDEVNKILSRL